MSGPAYEGWAVLEMFGHIKVAGRVSEVEMFGAKCGRIDLPALEPEDGAPAVGAQTQFFGGASVFRLTPCSEQVATSVARRLRHVAISTFEMYQPQLEAASAADEQDDDVDDVDDVDSGEVGGNDVQGERPW